uniref:NADH-ubiquinone oxidoreductase chain 6 n=1 Tax=Tenebrio molitor TaxID=7067 RepID=A0A075C9Q8_TENMO|nr:NADH dehydrogenase subunit 6 [Tenebrio molitor]AGX28419.1 NADH dehydrogenase subunit 6 [Tenebrio molitor]QDG00997.1 NADH dehydrogenase subunit 6 [Tenebrio molitor]UOX29710.1 NADH dehydrogenase subunit 6 [Tenebrio molitor]
MITTIMSMNLYLTITFLMMNHPLSMGFILLMQTIMISLITGNMNQNMWFSYILFLIMVGGMLILFMYMTSIASNEKFKMNNKAIIMSITIPLTMLTLNFLMMNTQMKNNEMTVMNNNTSMISTMNKFFTFPSSMIMIFMIMYLFMALVVTVKITNFKKGTMRQMN